MLQDNTIMRAASSILQRSERQQDSHKIVDTFVDAGILQQLGNLNNQIIYGRRGTGKTHVLKVLENNLLNIPGNAVVFIDARTLGSTSQFSDTSLSVNQRCICLFRDILGEIYSKLLEYIVYNPSQKSELALQTLDDLAMVSAGQVIKYEETSMLMRKSSGTSTKNSLNLGMNLEGIHVGANYDEDDSEEQLIEKQYEARAENKILFPELHHIFSKLLCQVETTLYILLDEWSSIPDDLQPFLAEFIKRSCFANSRIVVKIASLEYRSNFCERQGKGILGFEIGSDISTALDIDDYYVYDRNPQYVTNIFGGMLYKHLIIDLPDRYLETKYNIKGQEEFISRIFTNAATFQELVRASEGVARDLIGIFIASFFDSQRKDRDSIEKKSILESARQWFESDKSPNLDDNMHNILRNIVDEVIGTRKARSFLVPRELEKHDAIQKLFDARVLHLIKRGYADKINPGVRYNIYTLDYGTYVDLINTSNQPVLNFEFNEEATQDIVVPFDDKRSIRRIVLTKEFLSENRN